ncbi:MAG: PIN domain-containing protein [bacterium]
MRNKPNVYLDNSVLNRPFDDQSVPNNKLETIAFFLILKSIEQNKVILISSDIVEYENSKNPFPERKFWINFYIALAKQNQKLNQEIILKAQEIARLKIMPLDALHLACAEYAGVDYFITCDYDIIKRYKHDLNIINPVDFILNL